METSTQQSVSELTLDELFPKTLADSPCVYIDKDREVWVATEMCAQYLESAVDSIVVVDGDGIRFFIFESSFSGSRKVF